MTGTSFIKRSQKGVLGRHSGSPLFLTAYWKSNRDLVKVSCLYQGRRYSHHLPETEGRFLGRRGEGGELVLVLSWPRVGGPNHLPGVSGHWRSSNGSGMLPGISKATGERSARGVREVATASGGSAPTSGKAVHGGV